MGQALRFRRGGGDGAAPAGLPAEVGQEDDALAGHGGDGRGDGGRGEEGPAQVGQEGGLGQVRKKAGKAPPIQCLTFFLTTEFPT